MMPWVLFFGGAFMALVSGVLTLSPNGGSMLGVVLMLWGFWLIASRDVRDGL
jgi:hypothetical protein